MKYIFIFFILLFGGICAATINNMSTFGYGFNDAIWRVIWSIDEGTIWAQNFSEENFEKIRLGMTDHDVLELMGPPLYSDDKCVDTCFWYYTKQDAGTSDFDQRWLVFNKDKRVVEVRKSFFID